MLQTAEQLDREEVSRQDALRRYDIIDTPPEPNFDRLTKLASTIFDLPVCTLALVDNDRFWFKSKQGVDGADMPRHGAFCSQTISQDAVFVVDDAFKDERFATAPLVAGAPHLRFYAGAPLITPSGARIGSLCVLSTDPQLQFSSTNREILSDLAMTAVELLEARSRQIELARCTDEIAHLARHDPLTGLPNRRRLRELVQLDGYGGHAFLFIDLDGFKLVNDRCGHAKGDALLRQVADRLRQNAPADAIVARLGGDEFAVVLRGKADGKGPQRGRAETVAARLIYAIKQPYLFEGHSAAVGASIGISFAQGAWSLDRLIEAADEALYAAKANGRGRYQVA